MYGILLESVRECIKKEIGLAVWKKIEEHLNLENSIIAHNTYPDEIFVQVIECLILYNEYDDRDFNSYMELFGTSFVGFFSQYGYEKLLKIAGRSFSDFLHSIDQLHESNNYNFPKMKNPLFFVGEEDSEGLYLNYQTKRRGFNYYVIGQLKECAKAFFKMELNDVRIHEDLSNDEYNHVVFRIDFDNKTFKSKASISSHNTEKKPSEIVSINPDIFLNVFPCSLGFDRSYRLKHVGQTFINIFDDLYDLDFFETFTITRPKISNLNWNKIIELSSSVIFELENKKNLRGKPKQAAKLKLKGQMKFNSDLSLILFIGHPVLKSMEEMHEVGIYLNDLNQFDGSAGIMVTEMQHNENLKKAFEEQQDWTFKLEVNKTELNTWKNRSKTLLYSMLPYSIAVKIEEGIQPNTICQSFENVTIMFINTADFSSLITNAEPTDIIKFINSTITVYDKVVDTYEHVNKIETKADGSYMIVAGLNSDEDIYYKRRSKSVGSNTSGPKYTKEEMPNLEKKHLPQYNQVELISAVALEILNRVQNMKNPFNKSADKTESLKIKIGFHSGSIVAGIVGLSRIQFCLFGDTVNTASRMCSNSMPGRVCFSEHSYKHLEDSKFFDSQFRDIITVKGKGQMRTYWLVGKKEK